MSFWKRLLGTDLSDAAPDWPAVTEVADLDRLIEVSRVRPVMILKHSPRCGVSGIALRRLAQDWDEAVPEVETVVVDVLSGRAMSDAIAERFGIRHQSPQVIVVRDGVAVHHGSHSDVHLAAIRPHLEPARE